MAMAHSCAILTSDEVREIRELYLSGDWSMADLAWKWGVQRSTIQAILEGNSWSQLLAEGEFEALRQMRRDRQLHRT